MATFVLIFNRILYESADSSGTSWVQEPFPATGAPQGVIALGTGAVNQWVLDSTFPTAPLWRRVDQNTFVPLNITSDLSPFFLDFYTTPFFSAPFGGGMNIVGDIGVPTGQTQQMYVQSTDGGQTAQTSSFGGLPFPPGSTLFRFWADERNGLGPPSRLPGFFLAQVRQQSPTTGPDFLYLGVTPFSWSQTPLLQTGPLVNQMLGDFIRKENRTFLVGVHRAPDGLRSILRSTDGGASWAFANIPSFAPVSQGLVECDNGTVLVPLEGNVSGTPGVVLRSTSTDDGQNFQYTLPIPGASIVTVWLKYFPGLDKLFAYVQQQTGSAPFGTAVYLSTDQGQTWTQVFTSAQSVNLSRRQVTSWMAITAGNTFWGVDSSTPANTPIPGGVFFDVLTAQAGSPPAFWGRYIGSPTASFNLTADEANFLHGRNCRILLIYGGTTSVTVGSYPDGVNAATNAINYITNNNLVVPGGKRVWIYCNTEPTWSPTADFFQGWSDTMFNSIYGGAGGVYGNTSAAVFNTPYCAAFTSDPNMRVGGAPALLWNNQPIICDGATATCDILAAHAPAFNPNRPPCNPPTVLYQYSINNTLDGVPPKVADVDLDVANGAGFAGMW